MSPKQPIKLSDLDKSLTNHGGLLIEHICEKVLNISNETAETVNFHFFHYKSIKTISCHSKQGTHQRTNGSVNAHLISWPSNAQNINQENIW